MAISALALHHACIASCPPCRWASQRCMHGLTRSTGQRTRECGAQAAYCATLHLHSGTLCAVLHPATHPSVARFAEHVKGNAVPPWPATALP